MDDKKNVKFNNGSLHRIWALLQTEVHCTQGTVWQRSKPSTTYYPILLKIQRLCSCFPAPHLADILWSHLHIYEAVPETDPQVFKPSWMLPPIFMMQGQILRDPLWMVSAERCSQRAFISLMNLVSQQWHAQQKSRMMLLNCWHLANGSVAKALKDL